MSPSRVAPRAEILLVEDNPGDVRLTLEALKQGNPRSNIHVVGDGEQAMLYLRNQGPYASEPRPDLVLLDLNLPRKDGREVLGEMKSDASLRTIPVVVLTTSDSELDILRSYDLHANCYITKPADLERFLHVVRQLEDFWLNVVKLPP